MLREAIKDWRKVIDNPDAEVFTVQRTNQQNDSMWLAFRLLEKEFLERGLDMKVVLEQATREIPWTPEAIHESIYNPISKAMYGTTSSGLDSDKPSKVWEQVQRFTREHWDFEVPWPDRFNGGKA